MAIVLPIRGAIWRAVKDDPAGTIPLNAGKAAAIARDGESPTDEVDRAATRDGAAWIGAG